MGAHVDLIRTNITVNSSGGVYGVMLYGPNASLNMSDSSITKTGPGTGSSAGIYVMNGNVSNIINITNSRILASGNGLSGIYSTGSIITADHLTIDINGDRGHGIIISSVSNNTILNVSNSDITTTGADTFALRVNRNDVPATFVNSRLRALGTGSRGVVVTAAASN